MQSSAVRDFIYNQVKSKAGETPLGRGLFYLAETIANTVNYGIGLLDREININHALDELYNISRGANNENDLQDDDFLNEINEWEAKNKNALIYDSRLIEWLNEHLISDQWSNGSKSRFCFCVAQILMLRQTRVDAHEELLRDLKDTQKQMLEQALRKIAQAKEEKERRNQSLEVRIDRARTNLEESLKFTEQHLGILEIDEMLARMELESALDVEIDDFSDLRVDGVDISILEENYRQIQQWHINMRQANGLAKWGLAQVDILDKCYLAIAQREEIVARLLEKTERLKKNSEIFLKKATALRHQEQGKDAFITTGMLMFVGGVAVAATVGAIGTVGTIAGWIPFVGGALQSVTNGLNLVVLMGSLGGLSYSMYHYNWGYLQDIKRVVYHKVGKLVESAPGGSYLAKGAHIVWNGISTAAAYLMKNGFQCSVHAYHYILEVVESDARARVQEEMRAKGLHQHSEVQGLQQQITALQQEVQSLREKSSWQENLIEKFHTQMNYSAIGVAKK